MTTANAIQSGRKLPSLRAWLLGIIVLVVLPNLVVVAAALMHSGRSFRELSENRLLETSRLIAQSAASELIATERFLISYMDQRGPGIAPSYSLHSALIAGADYMVYRIPDTMDRAHPRAAEVPPGVMDLAERAFVTGQPQVSNILEAQLSDQPYALAIAMPMVGPAGIRLVAAILATPQGLVHALGHKEGSDGKVILAITDGNGRIIGRSVDGQQAIGRQVPDWAALQAIGKPSGAFRAKTIEGGMIMFAFQEIPGTPGWMAVAGEPLAVFEARWQDPIRSMVLVSSLTLISGLALALILLRRVLRPITALAERAQRVAIGDNLPADANAIPSSSIAEVEVLRRSLVAAETEMNLRLADSRRAEATAHRSLIGLEQAERLTRMGNWTYDIDRGRFQLSRMLRQLGELPAGVEELTVQELARYFSPADYDQLIDALQECMRNGTAYSFEARALLPSGATFMAWIRGDAILAPDGQVIGVAGTLQDIDERTEQNARLAALADNLPSGMILRIDRDEARHLRITYLSGGVEGLIGYSAAQILDHSELVPLAIGADHRGDLIRFLRDADETGMILDREFPILASDGREIWVRGRAGLRMQEGGRAIWDGLILDISAERLATEALREAKTVAEAAERAKGDFLATMSHEIRTPMNSVIGMARLALRSDLDPKQRHYLERIDDSAKVLLGIINDILDFSKIEAGALPLEDTAFRLEAVLETVASINAIRAEEKGLELTFSLAPDVPSYLSGDPLRLGQVLTNLVGNAIKFTAAGDIVVRVKLAADSADMPDAGRIRLVFSVQDSGIGISPDQLSSLFRPFTQGNADTARKYGGTGLGLAISRQIVALMQGGIGVESALGEGSTFTFTAEFGPVAPGQSPETDRVSHRLRLTGRRVLVVDDSSAARIALGDMIASFGAEVQTAESGAEALVLLRGSEATGQPYDIVILDWRMPEMDGIALARHIRQDLLISHMPAILMVTAFGQELALAEVEDIGFRDVLVKPVTPSLVYNSLMDALCAAPRPMLQPPMANGHDLHRARAQLAGRRVLVVDDNALNREVAREFLSLVGIEVTEACDGREGIDQMNAASFDAVLMDVHMPVMSGLEAIREIRSRPEWLHLPVIALTAQARVEDVTASLAAGMSGHLTKPIDEAMLFQSLIDLIALPAEDRAANPASEPPAPSAPPVPPEAAPAVLPDAPLVNLLARFGGTSDRLIRFVDGFLRDFKDMEQRFDELYQAQDLLELANYVHRVRGVVGYFGADELYRLCGEAENAARAGHFAEIQQRHPAMMRAMRDCMALLHQAQRELSAPAGQPAAEALQRSSARELALRARPLVQAGNFAARPLLIQLISGLENPQERAQATIALDEFDDLETAAAAQRLAGLIALLSPLEKGKGL